MTTRRHRLSAVIRVESLEGRVVLSSAATPIHALAAAHGSHAHVARTHGSSHKVAAIPNPILVNLTPQNKLIDITDVSFDPRIDLVTVKGVVNVANLPVPQYNYYVPEGEPNTIYINVSATQAVNRTTSVSGAQFTSLTLTDPTAKTMTFTDRFVASSGKFASGIVTLSLTEYDSYYYSYSSQSAIVRMRNLNAY